MSLTPLRSGLILAALVTLAVVGFRAGGSVAPPSRDPVKAVGDANLGLNIIERLRSGEPYYSAYGDELRRQHYPTQSILNWRTPLHYEIAAALSVEGAGRLLSVLALVLVGSGAIAYTRFSALKSLTAPLLLIGAILPAFLVRPHGVALPEIWAGVLIGLSLNAYILRQWIAGALLGIAAVFLRELAVPYGIACGVLAIHAGRRRESLVWAAGGVAYLLYYSAHVIQAVGATQPNDLAHAESWIRWSGFPFVLKTLYAYGWLTLLPPSMSAIAAVVGLTSVFARSSPIHIRLTFVVYLVVFSVVGQPFNFYWGYLTSSIWAHAFSFSADGTALLLRTASRPLIGTQSWTRAGGTPTQSGEKV